MTASRPLDGLSSALSALVADEVDVTDVLARLMDDAAEGLGAGAVALMARDARADLGLLAASSHRAAEIEMLQIQTQVGPCVDVLSSGAPIELLGGDQLVERWDDVGRAIVSAGFSGVGSFPVRWRGETLGGLNVFTDGGQPLDRELCQAFADLCSLVVVRSASVAVTHEQLRARMHEALAAREMVEQAKGVLVHTEGLDLEQAYAELVARSAGTSLTQLATDVVRRGQLGGLDGPDGS